MKVAYSVYLALSGNDYEVDAESILSNSECGRLNLLCPCCHERVYWVNRDNSKFFSHFPNVKESKNCENYTNKISFEQKKKSIISALNKEKTQYERYFWTILTQVYPVWEAYKEGIDTMESIPEANEVFLQFFYPALRHAREKISKILASVYNTESIALDEKQHTKTSMRMVKLVLKQNTKVYREVILDILLGFLMQKRSSPILRKFYYLGLLVYWDLNKNQMSSVDASNDFTIELLISQLLWVPWEECLNDIQCYKKILNKHRYDKDFTLMLMTVNDENSLSFHRCSIDQT